MRYAIFIEDNADAGVSTPWIAMVHVNGEDFGPVGNPMHLGYGSTPEAAAKAAVESWTEGSDPVQDNAHHYYESPGKGTLHQVEGRPGWSFLTVDKEKVTCPVCISILSGGAIHA